VVGGIVDGRPKKARIRSLRSRWAFLASLGILFQKRISDVAETGEVSLDPGSALTKKCRGEQSSLAAFQPPRSGIRLKTPKEDRSAPISQRLQLLALLQKRQRNPPAATTALASSSVNLSADARRGLPDEIETEYQSGQGETTLEAM
jgi:hypothetical protein